jgi:hypothetical protein
MLSIRDQENRVHAQQTTAAGKPLNQGIRALQPKTPGQAKTPFRRALNDENRPLTVKGQKTTLKGGLSKLDASAFVTPAPNRPPLGLKTTNARGHGLKTPGLQQAQKPEKTSKKPSTARRSAKSKITIAPTEPVQSETLHPELDDEPDYGYAPPPIVELPDPPIDFLDLGIGDLDDGNQSYLASPTDENGFSLSRKEEEANRKRLDAERLRQSLITPPLPSLPSQADLDAEVDAMIAAGTKGSRVDTVKAKSAAAALSRPTPRVPAVAMKGTKSSEQKRRPLASAQPTNTGRIPPPAVSKGTIGFPKARQAPSIIPKSEQMRSKHSTTKPKVDQSTIHPKDFVLRYGQPPAESNMWFRLKEFELLEQEEGADQLGDDLFDNEIFPIGIDGLSDDEEVFQLPMPE